MQWQAAQDPVTLDPVDRARPEASTRLRGALILVPSAAVLFLAAALEPRQAGYGTHEELGLPPCSFLARTGYPCPSCGLTTSFSAMARGRVVEAGSAHPFGVLLFAGTAAAALVSLGEVVSGRDCLRVLRPGAWWAVVAIAGLLGGWVTKIVLGLAAGTLPVR